MGLDQLARMTHPYLNGNGNFWASMNLTKLIKVIYLQRWQLLNTRSFRICTQIRSWSVQLLVSIFFKQSILIALFIPLFFHFTPVYELLNTIFKKAYIISSGHADVEWFDEFMQHCTNLDCRIDYIATHLYTGKEIFKPAVMFT